MSQYIVIMCAHVENVFQSLDFTVRGIEKERYHETDSSNET